MDACRYYRQAHAIPKGTNRVPHVEDSGPAGLSCFRRGTYRDRPDVVCEYPDVRGSLDFWAVQNKDGRLWIGEDIDEHVGYTEHVHHGGWSEDVWHPTFRGDPQSFPVYEALKGERDKRHVTWSGSDDWDDEPVYRVYPPRVRCSRLAFVCGLGYEAGRLSLPEKEHPSSGAPNPSADKFLGWYGFDTSLRQGGVINPSTEEGWGRPAFEFTPVARHADQSWAYAPATPSRDFDVAPAQAPDANPPIGAATTIPEGAWEYSHVTKHGTYYFNVDLPPSDISVDNWWLLAMIGGDPKHNNRGGAPQGKVKKLYWNPGWRAKLTFFGEDLEGDGDPPDHTADLFRTILRRIYAEHCKTPDIDPSFSGLPFPPGFLVDARVLAETWECKCTQQLIDAVNGLAPTILPRYTPPPQNSRPGRGPTVKIYLGTHFSVLYRCPFPIWRRASA